jgi:hypothetical protein
VQAVHLLLGDEQAVAADLERKAATVKGLLPSSSSSLTTFHMVDGATYNSALVTNLHVQATTVPNIRQLVNIGLDTTSSNYATWRDLMLMALTRYSLIDHVLSDDAFTDNIAWTKIDAVVLYWLTNMIIVDLQEVVWERGHLARHLWLALENQFLGNHETRTLHLDAAFRNFVQGDLSVTEYCRKFNSMAEALTDLGSPVDDRILALNILRSLN